MRQRALWFSTAVLLLLSASAAADPLRYRAQPERERVWRINEDGLFLEEARKPRRVIKLPGWHWASWPYACVPDIAFGPRGEALVTSNVLAMLWKIDSDTLAVSVHRLELDSDNDKDVGFSGLVYSQRNGAYFAVDEHHGSLWRIDPLLRRAQKVALSEPVRGACSLSFQRQERTSSFSRLCLAGRSVNLSPDQRSAYVQPAGCVPDRFALIGGSK